MYVGNISMEKKNELLSIILLPNPFEIFAPLNKGNMLSCKGGGECYGKCVFDGWIKVMALLLILT